MRKLLPAPLIVILLFLSLISHGQQTVLEVKSFEYVWQGGNSASRAIIAMDDSAKLRIKNSFAKAIKERWNIALPEVTFTTKPLPFLVGKPKFKTQLKDKEPGKWYLFLQIFENINVQGALLEEDAISTSLELRCRIISGANDSVITDKALNVNIHKSPSPPDQVPLTRLPAYPAEFVQGFDSIATWLFQPEQVSQKMLKLKPACVFQSSEQPDKPLSKLTFQRDVLGIHQLTTPSFTFEPSSPKYERTGIKRNAGGRSIGGAFTLLTGIGSTKTKYYYYRADYAFKDKDTTWHCLIGYTEEEMADRERVRNEDGSVSMQSTDYRLYARYMDSHVLNAITLDADTIATFNVKNKIEASPLTSYDQLWDGKDSTTIVHLPPEWNNKIPERDLVISGKIRGDTFMMKTWKGKRIKEFYLNDHLAAIVQGDFDHVSGLLFQPISTHQLKIFTLLSSLPYAYFNGTN